MGRAPTSGNCHTCRMRRVKCDRGKPTCERCIKAGYECKGYETVLRIQSHSVVAGAKPGTARLAKIQTVSSFPTSGPDDGGGARAKKQLVRTKQAAARADGGVMVTTMALTERRRNQPHYSDGSSHSSRSRTGRESSENSSTDGTGHSSPPPELSLEGFVDDIAFSYFFHSYGWINMHSILLQDTSMRDTLTDGMGQDSLRALSYGLLGKDRHIQSLQSQGAKLYGSTLRKLHAKLSTQNKDQLAALIKPIAIMGSYLISVENDLRFTHHRGLCRIIEYCGPEYFQSPSLLPVFDSCRLTIISNCIVRRTTTFLSQEKWKTVPWDRAPHLKSWTSKLLDLMTDIPNLIDAVLNVMVGRVTWANDNYRGESPVGPEVVPALQERVEVIKEGLANWRIEWESAYPETGSKILAWSFSLAEHDDYRPGLQGFVGPDVYNYSLLSPVSPPPFLSNEPSTFNQMQDVALYTTVLVWAARLTKYLAGAAVDQANIDFYNTSFFTTCTCCTSKLADMCDTVPDSDADVLHVSVTDPDMSWNFNAARIAVAPIKVSLADNKPIPIIPIGPHPPEPNPEAELEEERRQAQLRHQHQQLDQLIATSKGFSTSASTGTGSSSNNNNSNNDNGTISTGGHRPPPLNTTATTSTTALPTSSSTSTTVLSGSASGASGAGVAASTLSLLPSPPASAGFPQTVAARNPRPPMLLPGDVRFSSQLRILSWLTDRLPASRPQVLSTLAAIGLGHCGHDVRPLDGLRSVADVVARTLFSTQFEGADNILLRRYR